MNRKHFRRIFSAVLTLIMVFILMAPFANAASGIYYTDVTGNSTQTKAINYLHEHGIMGRPFYTPLNTRKAKIQTNNFAPNKAITRLQLVHALWNMYGAPTEVDTALRMRDLYSNEEHITAMRWAVETGILDFVGNGRYSPDEALSIKEVVLMLYRFLDNCGYDVSYSRTSLPSRLNTDESDHAINWALSKGLITEGKYTADCSRGSVATYLYKIYAIYQKKYGLTVVNTQNNYVASRVGQGMSDMFRAAGAKTISRKDINYNTTNSNGMGFVDSMAAAFSEALPLDICYLSLFGHGNTDGLDLFREDYYDYWDDMLEPRELRAEINKYDGTFVVFISACHSGTFIKKDVNGTEPPDDLFDAENFVAEFTAAGQGKRSTDNMVDESGRIKVFCSSSQSELSWSTAFSIADNAWMTGCGMARYPENYYFAGAGLPADANGDCKVSMAELFDFAYEKVLQRKSNQHMVCYPENDDTIIFEIREWEFIG